LSDIGLHAAKINQSFSDIGFWENLIVLAVVLKRIVFVNHHPCGSESPGGQASANLWQHSS